MDDVEIMLEKAKQNIMTSVRKNIPEPKEKPLLSIIIMFREEDSHWLPEQLKNLPEYAEVVYCRTVKQPQLDVQKNERFIFCDYKLTDPLNFSHVMNYAKKYCHGEFIMKLDSDELLLLHQFQDLKNTLEHALKDDTIGGINCWVGGCNGDMIFQKSCQTRIIKNKPTFYWVGGGHETPNPTIEKAKKEIYNSNIFIHHLGYEVSDEITMQKVIRNIRSLLLDTGIIFSDSRYFSFLIRECNNLYKLNERKNNGI